MHEIYLVPEVCLNMCRLNRLCVEQSSLTQSFTIVSSSGVVPFYKDHTGENEKRDETGTNKPSNWAKLSLETLLLLWVDYIKKCVDWREHKLEILRDLIGTPVVKNAKIGPAKKTGRWRTLGQQSDS